MSIKSIGIVRKIDELGRVVLPMELRRVLDMKNGEPLEIFVDGDSIMLRKYTPGCTFCGNVDNIKSFKSINGKIVCPDCIAALSKIKK